MAWGTYLFPQTMYMREFVPRLGVKELIHSIFCRRVYISICQYIIQLLPVFILERILDELTSLKVHLPSFFLDLIKNELSENHKLLSCLLSLILVFAPVFLSVQDVIVEAEWDYTVQLILLLFLFVYSFIFISWRLINQLWIYIPIPIPPPTSFPIPSLWVFPVGAVNFKIILLYCHCLIVFILEVRLNFSVACILSF